MDREMRKLYHADEEERTRVMSRLAEACARESNIAFAYLYGSFVDANAFHDVDIGVYVHHIEAGEDTFSSLDLGQRLADSMPFPIDVRIINHAPVSFLYHVLSGRPLHVQDEELLTDLMEQVGRQYLDMAPLLRQSTRDAFVR